MAERSGRPPKRSARTAHVVRTERLTPHMLRIVLGGEGLADFPDSPHTDAYVKLLFPAEGAVYPEPFDIERVRAELPREQWPRPRTYTVRRWQDGELWLDFVHHGDEGLAGPWAAAAKPGDRVLLLGPGGGYAPAPESDWHLLVGDESALPAIAVSLERMPAGAVARVLVEIAGPEEEQKLETPAGAEVRWLHRGDRPVGTALVEAVRALDFPPGTPECFVHGEAGMVREVRRLLRLEHGVPRELLSASGYWRLGADDEAWRAAKKEWNQAVEAEQERAGRDATAED
jgi:NADPH-dependent ferric siderophore reductase